MPAWLLLILILCYFVAITKSIFNYYLMSFRMRNLHNMQWMIYFGSNFIFNIAITIILLHVQLQMNSGVQTPLPRHVNVLFGLLLVGHIAFYHSLYKKSKGTNLSKAFLAARIFNIVLLIPVFPAQSWVSQQFGFFFVLFTVQWFFGGIYYLVRTLRYLVYHFSDYTKQKAFELSPIGIIITNQHERIIAINIKAESIFADLTSEKRTEMIFEKLNQYDGLLRHDKAIYRINHYNIFYDLQTYTIWELVDITELMELQNEIDAKSQSIMTANQILQEMMDDIEHTMQIEEKHQLAQHVHDVLGEDLSIINITLQSLAEGKPSSLTVDDLIQIVDNIYRKLETRAVSTSQNLLDSIIITFRQIGVQIKVFGHLPKSYRLRSLTYHILREASTNAVRHGGSTEIELHLSFTDTIYQVEIKNNGYVSTTNYTEGMGLSGMRRLVESQRGLLRIFPEENFLIQIEIPLENNQNAKSMVS